VGLLSFIGNYRIAMFKEPVYAFVSEKEQAEKEET